MKTLRNLITAGLLSIAPVVLADDPESLALEAQFHEMNHLMKAMEAADAISVMDGTEAARKKYQTRDNLAAVLVSAYQRMVDLLAKTPDAEWTKRLVHHYLNHHLSSGAEGWTPLIARLCLNDKSAVIELYSALPDSKKASLLQSLRAGNNSYKPEVAQKFSEELSKMNGE